MKMEKDLEKVRGILAEEGCMKNLSAVDPEESLIPEGGKLLRPKLVILSALLCEYGGEAHIGCAAAVELLHNSTLFHDDIMDNGLVRRGKPTLNARFGGDFALMAGDHLMARAFSLAALHGGADAALALADCYRDVIFGQMKEMETGKNPGCAMADYYTVIDNKTAALFRVCAEIGALCAGAEPGVRALLADISFRMGRLFQVADDMFDYLAPVEKTGKKKFQDAREGKMTLPLLLLLEKCSPEEKEFVRSCIGNEEMPDSGGERLVELFRRHAIIKHIGEMHRKLHDELSEDMEKLPVNEYTEQFRQFINKIVNRIYPALE